MRYLFLFCLITLSTLATGADYYISSSGNDSNNGLAESTPWKTIARVNAVFPSIQPGDRILFKRGDTFYGTLVIKKSGISGAPITIGAYGTGSQPVITGFLTLSSWINEGNGIYSSRVTSSAQTNMVTVNGAQVAMGRYPDSGTNLTYASPTSSSITDSGIGDATDWAGAEVVINKNDWTLDRCRISNHAGDVFTFLNLGSDQTPYTDRYYYIQNDLRCVTKLNEWYHSISAGKFYIYGDPSSKTVKIATINNLIDNAGYDFITIDGLNLQGSISNPIFCSYGTENWTIKNCAISFAGHSGINFIGGSNIVIDSNKISYCNSTGIYAILNTCKITNNSILNIGMVPGQSILYHPIGIYISGSAFLLQYNDIQYSAWSAISSGNGTTCDIKNNFINYSCLILDDGGGIYLASDAMNLRTIEGNIVLNCGVGGFDNDRVRGLCLDVAASNVLVKDNTFANCFKDGIVNNGGSNNKYIGNTTYNNTAGILFQQYSPSVIMTGTTLSNNILFAKESEQYALRFIAPDNNILNFGTADYNYYLRPVKDDDIIITYDASTGSQRKTLEGWQYFTGQDANSKKSPITITDINDIRFEYNASKNNKVVNLERPVIDVKGTKYENTITLQPYTSVILMNLPDPSFPVVPVYLGSLVENISPTKIEMNYDLILANVVPNTSAFKILVNSTVRTINTVTISGTKAELILSSPISYGDVVTVSYSIPATNRLQSESTGLAESLTAKPVTNKVDSRRPRLINSVIENGSPDLLRMTFNLNLASIDPPGSAFDIKVNSYPRTVTSAKVTGTDVVLTLDRPVATGDIVSVAYNTPSTNALRSTLNWYVIAFSAQPVTNNIEGFRPVFESGSIDNSAPNVLKMQFDLPLASIVPPASSFIVIVNSVQRTISSVYVAGTEVKLTMASPVVNGDNVTVAYTIPSSNALRSTSGWYVQSFLQQPVTNKVDAARPVLVSSVVEHTAPANLKMIFSQSLATIAPPGSAFSVLVNSVPRSVNAVAISGTEVTLTLSGAVVSGDIVTVDYTIPSVNSLRSVTGWYVLSFNDQPVNNNVNTLRPVLVSSSVESSAPGSIIMTFSLDLANILPSVSAFRVMVNYIVRSVNTVSINGSDVILSLSGSILANDVVTVAYTMPSTSALRSLPGWYVLSFSAQPVTNNVDSYRPALVSASVEFTTPSILDMIFSLTLSASYVPPASAFTVIVNSLRRTVNAVTISGTNVKLILASPVKYGDAVTVAYTVGTNALRSVPGWYVLAFTAQSVTNKCLASSSLISKKSNSSDDPNLKIYPESGNYDDEGPHLTAGEITIYPNPTIDHFTIFRPEPSSEIQLMRIFSYSGKLCKEIRIDPEIKDLQIPIDLESGTYIMKLTENNRTVFTGKLVILK